MDYRTVRNEENDAYDGQDQALSPFIQFETQEDENTHEKRTRPRHAVLLHARCCLESRWSHQQDLDDFFVRIYQYHQKHGFFCIALSELFGLV